MDKILRELSVDYSFSTKIFPIRVLHIVHSVAGCWNSNEFSSSVLCAKNIKVDALR